MWKNYYKIAIRNLFNNKTFSAINIFGLAVGIACCLLMFLFIQNELSFDQFHSKKNNIYRIISRPQSAENSTGLAVTPAPWAPLMKKDYPEIKQYTRLLKDEKGLVGEKGQPQLVVNNVLFADSGLFDVFSFKILKGNPSTALTAPNSIILTSDLAKKIFGNTDPIGKLIEVNTSFTSATEVLVTGVAASPPDNSHIKYGALISMSTLGDLSEHWSYHMYNTYVVLENGASPIALENKLKLFSQKYLANNPNANGVHNIYLQPLTDIHLHSHLVGELENNGDISYVYIFSGIAFFVLCIASLNFMNLSTVRSLKRAKEVGMRKVIGAARSQLIKQFLTEAMLISFLALMMALIFVVLGLPVFSQISGRELGLKVSDHLPLFLMVFILTGLTGVLSGIYPAAVLSGFNPIDALKGSFLKDKTGTSLRKILVTFQFVICIVLMSGTMIVYKQLQFIQNKNLGFNKEKVIIAHISQNTDTLKLQTLKNVLGRLPGVESVSAASTIPGPKIPVNMIHNGNSRTTKNSSMQMLFVDENFLRTMQMKLIAGRDFSKDFPGDPGEGFIINQEAVKQLDFENAQNALGKPFQWVLPDRVLKSGKIIGVVQDFNI
ncbi:MAG TPA: ABC transporter permease, partial [Puia sp.]|nr:ABC transporter permease [Puia sp.]